MLRLCRVCRAPDIHVSRLMVNGFNGGRENRRKSPALDAPGWIALEL
jgi:hypothetical protein